MSRIGKPIEMKSRLVITYRVKRENNSKRAQGISWGRWECSKAAENHGSTHLTWANFTTRETQLNKAAFTQRRVWRFQD